MGLYSYSYQNPVKYSDPDGRWVNIAIGAVIGAGIEGWKQVATGEFSAGRLGAAAGGGAVAGAVAGATMGLSLVAEGGAVAAAGVVGVSSAAGGSTTRALMGEKVTPGTVATDAAVGVATFGVLKGAGAAAGSAKDFFAGSKYTPKVQAQMQQGDLHAFPESVAAFQGAGQVSQLKGGDGVVRDMLKIPGSYQGKNGNFEFIKEPNGDINHRYFNPAPDK